MVNDALIGTEIHGPLTVEQAHAVELPSLFRHPVERIQTIGRLASETSMLMLVGWTLRSQLAYTRRGLVKQAELHEGSDKSRRIVEALRARQHELHSPSDEGIIHED